MKNILKLIAIVGVLAVSVNVVDAKMLSVGSTGSDVADLQAFLVNNGYPIPLIDSGVAKPGYFGEQTKNAVKMYQEGNEMNPTGMIDSEGYGSVKLGSVVGPDLYSPYFNVNGNTTWYYQSKLYGSATTTPCSFKTPGATTTLEYGLLKVTTGTSTTLIWTFATSTKQNATTSPILSISQTSGTQGSLSVIATSSSLVDGIYILPPNSYVTWGAAGGPATGVLVVGTCQMAARQI